MPVLVVEMSFIFTEANILCRLIKGKVRIEVFFNISVIIKYTFSVWSLSTTMFTEMSFIQKCQ